MSIKEPPYTAHFQHHQDMNYSITVIRTADRVRIQTIKIRNAELSRPNQVKIIYSNDHTIELHVFGGKNDGKAWYKIWVFDQTLGKFIWSRTTN